MSNSIDNISDEEIFKLLDEIQQEDLPKLKQESNLTRENKDVLFFIKETKISPGINKVPTYVIYYLYIQHCKRTCSRKWGNTEFFRTFNKRFESKRSGNQRFYLINDAFELSKDLYDEARKFKEKNKKKLKKKSK